MAIKGAPSVLFIVSLSFVICSAGRALFTHEDRNVLLRYGAVVHRALTSGPSTPGPGHCSINVVGGPGAAARYVRIPSGRGVGRGKHNGVGGSPDCGSGVGGRGHKGGSGGRKGGKHGGYAP